MLEILKLCQVVKSSKNKKYPPTQLHSIQISLWLIKFEPWQSNDLHLTVRQLFDRELKMFESAISGFEWRQMWTFFSLMTRCPDIDIKWKLLCNNALKCFFGHVISKTKNISFIFSLPFMVSVIKTHCIPLNELLTLELSSI